MFFSLYCSSGARRSWRRKSLSSLSPKKTHYDRLKAALGKRLFFDPGLSKDGTVACVSCHHPLSGADVTPGSVGVGGQKGLVNAPTVFNALYNFRQGWNGSARDLADQVQMPIQASIEMGMSRERIESHLRKDPLYRSLFQQIYRRPPNLEDMQESIAEFEKALVTPDSLFDRYLRGEAKLNEKQREGLRLFKTLGCVTCHNGVNLGGNSYQKMGLINPYPWKESNPDRYALTHRPEDKNVYKVPTLRNIALTAPYFHDGSAKDLREALKKMAYHNLGFELSEEELEALVAFLETLTGKRPAILEESEDR